MKKVLALLVVVSIFYSLFLVVVPHYEHFAFRSDLKEILKVSVTDNSEQVMTKVMNLAQQNSIPITAEDVNLEKNGHYVVKISWEKTVDFFTVYQKTFEFQIDSSE